MSEFGERQDSGEARLDNLASKRERFEEAGRFPWTKIILVGLVAFVILFGGMYGYQRWQKSKEVGGPVVLQKVTYPAAEIAMVPDVASEQSPEGISFGLDELKKDWIVGFTYQRTDPMPQGYQMAAGGNILPLLAYIAPSGRLVVATSFCEPCRSTLFHFEGNQLVCDVCYTRWDLSTLMGVAGGCFDYPPEEVYAEIQGDKVFVPSPDLESWVPRAYEETAPASGTTMSTLPPAVK